MTPANCYKAEAGPQGPLAPLVARLLALHTPRQRSGGGGLHVVLRGKAPIQEELRSAWGVTTGVEVKEHAKGYIVAAPSVHPDTGAFYEWEIPLETAIAYAPDLWPEGFRAQLIRASSTLSKKPRLGMSMLEIRKMHRAVPPEKFESYDEWISFLAALHHETVGSDEGLAFAEECSRPGKYTAADKWPTFGKYGGDEKTMAEFVNLAKANGYLPPRRVEQAMAEFSAWKAANDEGDRQLSMSTADDVTMANVEWLWKLWVPKKYLTVCAADSGNGKSTATAGVVAVLTAALGWPDGTEGPAAASHVLWLGVEDPHAEMTVPRLVAAGAVRKRVHFIDGVKSRGETSLFSLQDDLGLLRAKLREMRAKGNGVSAIIVDPVTAYMHGKRKIDPHKATELRSVLTPFAQLAHDENVSIVAITHLTKDKARGFIDSVLGSGALVQVARMCIGFARVPEEGNGSFAMFWGKGNLGPPGVSIRYAIEPATVLEPKTGEHIQTSKVAWGAEDATITKETIWGSTHGPVAKVRNNAIAWLRQRLADSEWHDAKTVRDDAFAADISQSSLREAEMVVDKENRRGTWRWRLRQVD